MYLGKIKCAKLIALVLLCAGVSYAASAQPLIYKPADLHIAVDEKTKQNIFNSLDTLFSRINNGSVSDSLVDINGFDLNKHVLESFRGYENDETNKVQNLYKPQLINVYPLSRNEYSITVAYIGIMPSGTPTINAILNLIARNYDGRIVFALPLKHYTANWEKKTIGNVTYHYPYKINIERATLFDKKNTLIATKLGLKPEQLDFYLCPNYQEILKLLGYEYESGANGKYKDGYGVTAGNTIFSIASNEDFSHDVCHFYSGKINKTRNRIAEEGMAYNWGNAYYTKPDGDMIELKELVLRLSSYLKNNPDSGSLRLFENDTKIFGDLPDEISVRSVISGVLMNEIENRKGIEGILKMINSGKGMDSYFHVLNDILSINKGNFDSEVMRLVKYY